MKVFFQILGQNSLDGKRLKFCLRACVFKCLFVYFCLFRFPFFVCLFVCICICCLFVFVFVVCLYLLIFLFVVWCCPQSGTYTVATTYFYVFRLLFVVCLVICICWDLYLLSLCICWDSYLLFSVGRDLAPALWLKLISKCLYFYLLFVFVVSVYSFRFLFVVWRCPRSGSHTVATTWPTTDHLWYSRWHTLQKFFDTKSASYFLFKNLPHIMNLFQH